MFNSLDKSLLDRTIRILLQASSDLKTSSTLNGAWPNTADGRKEKRLCDSYARDARDLKNLSQRMINEAGDPSVEKYRKATIAEIKARFPLPSDKPTFSADWERERDKHHMELASPIPGAAEAVNHALKPSDDLGTGAGSGFPTTEHLLAGTNVGEALANDRACFGQSVELVHADGTSERVAPADWEADAHAIGHELQGEQFEQCGKPPADLADQAAVVVGSNG